jgi:hypothetical protein
MRLILASGFLLISCVQAGTQSGGPAALEGRIAVGVSVTEQSTDKTVERALIQSLRERGLLVGRQGDSVHFLIVVLAECLPSRPGSGACADSTQLTFGLWGAAPPSERVESGYVPAGFRSEQSGIARVSTRAVAGWIDAFIETTDGECFDRERLRRGITPVRDARRDHEDDGLWSCRLAAGRERVPGIE